MSKSNLRNTINLSKQKLQFQSRLTQSTALKTISRASSINSNPISSSSSMANITINFMKDLNFPKLFNNSPMLFSFNPQPQTSKHSLMRNSSGVLTGLSNGTRTPSGSRLSSINQIFDREGSVKKNNFFSKKSNELVIDISKRKNTQRDRPRSSVVSIRKQHKATVSSTTTGDNQSCLSSSYDVSPKLQNIKVFIRIKPSQNRDILIKPCIMRIDEKHIQVEGKVMAYDHIFAMDSLQEEVFEKVAKPVLSGVFQGYNGTIFAYGQTGSGKTHTIFGGDTPNSEGLIFRSIQFIFSNLKDDSKVSMSLLQIYKEQLFDLLNETKLELKIKQTNLGGVTVEGLMRIQLHNIQQTLQLIQNSLKHRRVASTKLNEKSSRSHTILTIYVQSMESESKLCLIDLAGSQKVNKAGVVGQNFEQMKKINYSLSCLGNVINALVTRKKSDHIPFRDSKLTRLLKDSLSGRFRTSIIVNCSSDFGTEDQTMSSLKFADRAKKVKITISKCHGKGKQNVEYLHKVIQQLTSDLQNTKRQLNKYKQICTDKPQQMVNRRQQTSQMTQTTPRQTIPSERAHLDQQMKKYGKQNKHINVISNYNKQKSQKTNLNPSINLSQISSLNVSKSTMNFFGEINSPSVSSLSYRQDDCMDDFSFHFNSIPRQENVQKDH